MISRIVYSFFYNRSAQQPWPSSQGERLKQAFPDLETKQVSIEAKWLNLTQEAGFTSLNSLSTVSQPDD